MSSMLRRAPLALLSFLLALGCSAACASVSFADDDASSASSPVLEGATKLLENVERRYDSLPLDFVTQPAALVEAEIASAEAEREASASYVQSVFDREQYVQQVLSEIDPEYIDIEGLGPRSNPAYYEFESVNQVEDDNANEDGSLGWWQARWFTAHDWSDIGKQIADMRPGDVVVIDGHPITVQGKFLWPQESTYMEIARRTGWDATILQTCVGDDKNIWIVYGR